MMVSQFVIARWTGILGASRVARAPTHGGSEALPGMKMSMRSRNKTITYREWKKWYPGPRIQIAAVISRVQGLMSRDAESSSRCCALDLLVKASPGCTVLTPKSCMQMTLRPTTC